MTIGRYYDAFALDARERPNLVVSWADGPVESGTLGAAGLDANFGIYLYDSAHQLRKPIFDDPTMWDIAPRPLVARDAPPQIASSGDHQYGGNTTLLAAIDVYKSSLTNFAPGSVYGVRVTEGFSVEEGVPRDFGLTEFEGAAVLGVAPVEADGSYAALIPANIPVRQQAIDRFGMALASETVWVSGAAGESRACGGCHESRSGVVVTQPGLTQAIARGPVPLRADKTRAQRVSTSFTIADTVGVPWDQALQGVFDRKCVSCHNGTPGPANPSWTLTDPVTNESFTWTFDLGGGDATYGVGDFMFSGYSKSHLSLMGPSMRDLEDTDLVLTGDTREWIEPGSARNSELIKLLNPPQIFPVDLNRRAFAGAAHARDVGAELTADEYYLLVLMADSGGQFYSRENAPGR
jgi:Hydrazine synthase alpha subunit middle domain